jgi:3-isopropylmalate/(R)-2-methylmalate dehydratase small subunit
MKAFVSHSGIVAPLNRANIDTDQIIPKQFLTRIERSGFGQFLFFDWRYTPESAPRPDFVLNLPRYQNASILIAGRNFGCGSSREHAPWALEDYGFRVVIAPSFADIFYNNCFKVGILPVILSEKTIESLVEQTEATDGFTLDVNLEKQTVSDASGTIETFEVDAFRKQCLIEGLDDIGLSLRHGQAITEFEKSRPRWMNMSS